MNPNEGIPTGQSNVQLPQTTVMDLNYDCLLKIFRYLEVEDLAIASQSCRRFGEVACEAFKYEWKDKMISLSTDVQEIRITTAILRNFGNQLQNIFIHFGEKWNDHLFGMIIEKCSSVELTEVDVSRKIIGQDNIDRFKNKFINLKRLGLGNEYGDVDLYEHFPTLEAFTLFGTPIENQHALQFISRNPQLKKLSLEYTICLNSARSLLESIDKHLPQLEQLELAWLPGVANETGYRPEFFKNLKRLSFCNFGRGYEMRHLCISNEKLEHLEFESGTYDSDVADFICHYKEVRKLSIHDIDYPLDYKDLVKLSENLPKLKEFELSSRCRNLNHQEIVKFVMGSKQMMTLTIEDHKLENVLEVSEKIQRKLDNSKWTVDCNIQKKKLVIRNKSTRWNQ